jgi:hypothetical protein
MRLKRPAIAGAIALVCALGPRAQAASTAIAQAPAQYLNLGNTYVPAGVTHVVGVDSVTGAACLIGLTSTCQLPGTGGSTPTNYSLESGGNLAGAKTDLDQINAARPALINNGIPTSPNAAASGIASVTGSIASATQSSSFTPQSGRLFNVTLSGTFTGSCQLERQLTASGSWYPVTVSAGGAVIQAEYWSSPASDEWVEGENGAVYRIDCASTVTGGGWVSGTISYRFDQ